MKRRLLVNVGHVDIGAARLWCHAVLIDMENHRHCSFNDKPICPRRICGLTYGGMPVFTVWIPDGAEPVFHPVGGGRQVMMSHDGNNYNLDSGIWIVVGETKIDVSNDDFRRPVKMIDLDQEAAPFGDEFDEYVLPYAGGQNYHRPQWLPIPARFKRRESPCKPQPAAL